MKPDTLVNHPPEVPVPADNRPVVAPIYQSVKFTFDELDEAESFSRGEREGFFYSRLTNPTLKQLQLTLAALQGREGCLLAPSGVAAVSLAMQSLCRQGDHILLFVESYGPTRAMARRILGRYGVRHTLLSIDDRDGIERTLAGTPTRLVVFESPTNPTLKLIDIDWLTSLARRHGALTVLDNTFAGLHNHGRFDIDVFVHSLTKYAAGHGDVMGGAVIASQRLIDIMRPEFVVMGATLDPHAAFLVQRGLKTYGLRYQRQCENALQVARFLEAHPRVQRVRHPGLASHPQHALAGVQMSEFGTMVAVDLHGGQAAARSFAAALQFFAISASLGSTESLVLPSSLLHAADLTAEQRQWSGIAEGTVRLSIGIEAIDDLLQDLEQALQWTR